MASMNQLADSKTRMSCMEIWGGNRAIAKSFEAPGLDIFVHSQPFQDNDAGGDIYYLTSCASGRISRFLLADVNGHGTAASGVAGSLRDLMRKNVNRIDQGKFVEGMNREFGTLSQSSGFATAVVATFFEPTRTLDVSVAGHPYPIYYRADRDLWVHLDPASTAANFENMPLGVVDETTYPRRKIDTLAGDMVLLYSDAFMESTINNDDDSMLGVSGILKLLNENKIVAADEVIPFLRDRIGSMATGNLVDDDASLILGHFTKTKVRMRDNLLAPIRLLGAVCDRTTIEKQDS
jgi:serine phosphatase RsbU (regulator of sigma subunit)